jgi:glycosyltransferase involved in cell wall biosynthesis
VILFVSGEYPPDMGGVGDYTARSRNALEQAGWLTAVASRQQVRRWNAGALVWLLRHLPRRGIVHIQYQAAAFDLLGDICLLPVLVRRFRPSLCTATTFHDARVPYLFPHAGGLRSAAVQVLARTSDAVIAADQRDLRVLGGPSPRHYHIPIGANVECEPPPGYSREAFRSKLGLAAQDLAVVYFGTFNTSKGVDLLLDAFERILAAQPKARLLLLGGAAGASDPTDRLSAAHVQSRISRLGATLVRSGWLEPRHVSAYLLASDVALLPYVDGASARRGSLLACAAHGVPIVSTQPAGAEVADYVDAVAANAQDLSEAVMRAWRDPAALRAASTALAERVSWPRIAARHIEVYERLLYSRR